MKIAVDCRYLGGSGIGRVLKGILDNLDFSKNDYYLIGKEKDIKKYPNAKGYLINDESAFSIKGIKKINKEVNDCDIFFSPNFIIPFNVKIKAITMLHDIIFLDMPKINSSYFEYLFKKFLLKRCMKKSYHVYTVSKFSQDRISHYFKKYQNKLSYCYNGTDEYFKTFENIPALNKENYILYVGNIKEHKGLKTLLDAYEIIKEKCDLNLYLVGDKETIKNKDESLDKYLDMNGIKFTGRLNDDELLEIERKAKFLIQPSLYEGFGLPPLEALYLKTKPIISDIEVFQEIFGDLDVVFFKVKDSKDLADKILNSDPTVNPNYKYMNEKFNFKNICNELEKEFN